MSVFAHEDRRARKDHDCDACRNIIPAKSLYATWVCAVDGRANRLRAHHCCVAVLNDQARRDNGGSYPAEWYFDQDSVVEALREERDYPARVEKPSWPPEERDHLRKLWTQAQEIEARWRAKWVRPVAPEALL